MKNNEIVIAKVLFENFENISNHTSNGVEFWFARDLQKVLGYKEWRNFLKVIDKAKVSCSSSGNEIDDHFVDANKTIPMPKGATKNIKDIQLTRYACYLIAQNGDSSKNEIAFAQNYFATQTRKFEILQNKLEEIERLEARAKLVKAEKYLSDVIFEQVKPDPNFAQIRNAGDHALFSCNTKQMKQTLGIPNDRPLADFLQTVLISGKEFAANITAFNAKNKKMDTNKAIEVEHVQNNVRVRELLINAGIKPESLPPLEDIKKVKRRIASEQKRIDKNPDKLK